MKKKISTLIVDGKEYTLTDDNKFVEGRRKKRTIDEFREKKGKMIPILVVPPDAYKEGAVYGFSNEKNYKEWLIENKLHKNYEREQKMLEKARRGPSPEERERIKKKVKEATEKFEKFLKENNLKANEIEKIEELRDNPYFSDPIHSAIFYDKRFYNPSGSRIVLEGDPCSWGYYPNLGDLGFDNKTSSILMTTCTEKVRIWDAVNFIEQGNHVVEIYQSNDDLANFWFWFGLWNNKASSALIR